MKRLLFFGTLVVSLLSACNDDSNGSSKADSSAAETSSILNSRSSTAELNSLEQNLSKTEESSGVEKSSANEVSSVTEAKSNAKHSKSSAFLIQSSAVVLSSNNLEQSSGFSHGSSQEESSAIQISSSTGLFTPGTMTDSRDKQVYRTTTIGTQTWMAENLRYWHRESKASAWEWTSRDPGCKGRLYHQELVYNPKYGSDICPSGWHVPSKDEMLTLIKYVDDNSEKSGYKRTNTKQGLWAKDEWRTVGKYVKSKSGWTSYRGVSNEGDIFGLNIRPCGSYYDGLHKSSKTGAFFWAKTKHSYQRHYGFSVVYDQNDLIYKSYTSNNHHNGGYYFSVRCVKD